MYQSTFVSFIKIGAGKMDFSYGPNYNCKLRCGYIHIYITHCPLSYTRRPCYGVFLHCSTVQFSNVSNNTCLALLPTWHNSTMILLHKANCLPVMLNIPEDLIFSNQDVATYKQKMRFCFTIISSLQKNITPLFVAQVQHPPKKYFWTNQWIFMKFCVLYKLFLKNASLLGL